MKENLRKIGTICLNTILIIVIVITIIFTYSFIQMKRKNTKYINIFGYTVMQVVTGSMADTINIKDIIIVKLTNQIDKDDIVTFQEENILITHRVVEIENDIVTTKGDANNSYDTPIKKQDIIGKVVFIIPKVGIWQKVLTTPKVIISGSITICLLYFIINKDKRKE